MFGLFLADVLGEGVCLFRSRRWIDSEESVLDGVARGELLDLTARVITRSRHGASLEETGHSLEIKDFQRMTERAAPSMSSLFLQIQPLWKVWIAKLIVPT